MLCYNSTRGSQKSFFNDLPSSSRTNIEGAGGNFLLLISLFRPKTVYSETTKFCTSSFAIKKSRFDNYQLYYLLF